MRIYLRPPFDNSIILMNHFIFIYDCHSVKASFTLMNTYMKRREVSCCTSSAIPPLPLSVFNSSFRDCLEVFAIRALPYALALSISVSLSMNPLMKAISSGAEIVMPCLDWIVSMKLAACNRDSIVPVSSHAKPLPNSCTSSKESLRYISFSVLISSSLLALGCTLFALSETPFGYTYNSVTAYCDGSVFPNLQQLLSYLFFQAQVHTFD